MMSETYSSHTVTDIHVIRIPYFVDELKEKFGSEEIEHLEDLLEGLGNYPADARTDKIFVRNYINEFCYGDTRESLQEILDGATEDQLKRIDSYCSDQIAEGTDLYDWEERLSSVVGGWKDWDRVGRPDGVDNLFTFSAP
ncbi:MAG: hypothetical protein F6J98_02140 [Moorea sp. SIO4G2]|nr:hypothetical protein [Moorena sp. SIO4G2]